MDALATLFDIGVHTARVGRVSRTSCAERTEAFQIGSVTALVDFVVTSRDARSTQGVGWV